MAVDPYAFIPSIPGAEQGTFVLGEGGQIPYIPIPNPGALNVSLGNWVTLTAISRQTQNVPNDQSAPAATTVAALVLRVQATGIFLVGCRGTCSSNTEGDTIEHSLNTLQSAGAGVIGGTGAAPEGFHGTNASGASGAVLGADAAGGNGLLLDGSAIGSGGTRQHLQDAVVLAGQGTAAAAGTFAFGFSGIVHRPGAGSSTKTPFTTGDAVAFGFVVSAGGVVAYQALEMFALELPFG